MPSQRDKENKQREDFQSAFSPDLHMPSGETLRSKPKPFQKKEEVKKPNNFDVNFIEDVDFEKEVEYLPIRPHSDLVFVIGPRVENSSAEALELDEKTANALLDEKLKALGAGFRVVAISNKVKEQRIQSLADFRNLISDEELLELAQENYVVGDYIIYQAPLRLLKTVNPLNPAFAYYEVRNIDVRYSMTQQQALKFKPVVEPQVEA